MSILICLILLYGNIFENSEKTRQNRYFSYAIAACILALLSDAVSWIFDGHEDMKFVLYASTSISLIMTLVIDIIFVWYITEYASKKHSVSLVLPRIFTLFATVVILAIAASSGSGLLFTFEDGVYREGAYYTVYFLVNLICSFFCLCISLINMKSMSAHDNVALTLYIVIPWIAGGINLFYESFSYVYPAIALSLVVLYVMVQSERQGQLEEEGLISKYHARHDTLTGLANRLAYEEKLKELSGSNVSSCVIFSDVNGLKFANDNFGHEAGDSLLIRYAERLRSLFPIADIFRISGDEFVILMSNADEDTFRTCFEKLYEVMNADDPPMASIGFACGNSMDINELIKKAETEMYINKDVYHKNHPEMRRQ